MEERPKERGEERRRKLLGGSGVQSAMSGVQSDVSGIQSVVSGVQSGRVWSPVCRV